MGQWGFGKNGDLAGTVCLFTGEPGTGKTLAAEAVGFETGKPLKVSHLVRPECCFVLVGCCKLCSHNCQTAETAVKKLLLQYHKLFEL